MQCKVALIILFVSFIVSCLGASRRKPKHIFHRLPSFSSAGPASYDLCSSGGEEGACLSEVQCKVEGGRVTGHCTEKKVCCIVEKSCDHSTKSHSVLFRNPSYPRKNKTPRPCNFRVRIGRGICAVRMNFDLFELAPYEDGLCIVDTMTVLGSKDGVTTPVCGNMTNWGTSFAVMPHTQVTLAMVVQGKPPHRFSIRLTQLACDDIHPFHSPTYSGIHNIDAVEYIPTSTTSKPNETATTTATTSTTTTTTESSLATTQTSPLQTASSLEETTAETAFETTFVTLQETTLEETTSSGSSVSDESEESLEDTEKDGYTLPIVNFPSSTTSEPEIVFRSNMDNDDLPDESIDVTPAISVYKKVFNLVVNDKCWKYEDEIGFSFRIIGGRQTNLNEYPWQVGLVYKRKFFCGGSLISDRHILTASHCIFGSFKKGFEKHLIVLLGDHDLRTKTESQQTAVRVKRIMWNLHYSPHTNVNDIALIEIAQPVAFQHSISAIRLPYDNEDQHEGQNATVTGWGRYSIRTKKTNTILKEYTGTIVNITKCTKSWEKYPSISAHEDIHICLDIKKGTPCHGDSGGPLFVCTGVQCTQVGVVSFGFPMCVNAGFPAVFSRVSFYKPWIDFNLSPIFHHQV